MRDTKMEHARFEVEIREPCYCVNPWNIEEGKLGITQIVADKIRNNNEYWHLNEQDFVAYETAKTIQNKFL